MYSAILPLKLNGDEQLLSQDKKSIASLNDFWRWAYSDLIGNSERGALAEFIVACALGVNHSVRVSWDKYDLITEEGIKIEVKTSGYIQTWEQKELSKPIFGIQPTHGWNSITNEFDSEQKRQSDAYVFCHHKHKEQATVNPLLIEQWDFYILSTEIINNCFGNQKTASLSALIKAGAQKCAYEEIYTQIRKCIK